MAIRNLHQPNSMVSYLNATIADQILHAENLTKEQYTGVVPTKFNALSASRDTLNPLLNAKLLKDRL